ncbi:MAG: QueT transporter family protein [Clostridiales bacterium]|nr:QueT transporter family protein [Clostridiales bacterium]
MRKNSVRSLCFGAMVAAVYAALTMALPMLSYSAVQIRFAEALTVLPFFFPEAVPGLFLGCAIANLLSAYGMVDVVFGSLATLLAALWTSRVKHPWLAPLPPVVCNLLIVGGEIAWLEAGFGEGFLTAWALNALTVGVGELAACYILGMLLLIALPHIPFFRKRIPARRLELAPGKRWFGAGETL